MTTSPPTGLRILLVEDEAVIAMTAEDMIEELGCVVSGQAATVKEALDHVQRDNFDLALLDINLNGIMSTPVAHALRAAGKQFIFTTGYGISGSDISFADVPVVTKPYTLFSLSAAISDMAGTA
jgi:CheY-like chemotaxis protein